MTDARLISSLFSLALLLGCSDTSRQPIDSTPVKTAAVFMDCDKCPKMVLIPAGEFLMGSPASERYRGAEMQHRVRVQAFAIGAYEVTFDEWEACVADGGCNGLKLDDHTWGRGTHPAIGVNWNDANAYAAWLTKKTGKPYRLPSESEWEYAARAGTTTPFSSGPTISSNEANYDGTTAFEGGAVGPNRQATMPVGSFPPNAFGLYDMHGNVWEWVQDCWSDEYTSTSPADGSALLNGDCTGRILRGGSWEDYAGDVRAAARVASGIEDGTWSDGFRVVRAP